jgi:mRNA-degrading endonuclease RelE of RelBE toxin-antitoxin system
MNTFVFTKSAQKQFLSISSLAQTQIKAKLGLLKNYPDIIKIMKPLHNLEPATHRLRIGAYRLLLCLKSSHQNDQEFWILKIGHRKDVYK